MGQESSFIKKAMKKSVGIRENSYSLFHSSQSPQSEFEQRITA